MSKFQTIHSHHKNLAEVVVHLLVPTLSFFISPILYKELSLGNYLSQEKFSTVFAGVALSLSGCKYGFDASIPTQKVLLTHLDGRDSFVTIEAQNTWLDFIMKVNPILLLLDCPSKTGGFGVLGGSLAFLAAAYEAWASPAVKYNFYEEGHRLDNLSIDLKGEQILEEGIAIPFYFIEFH